MLTLMAPQPECLWDESLAIEVKELPEDLAGLDGLLCDLELLWPLVERWRQEFEMTGRAGLTEGRPTIAMETYVRLMVLKQRYRWGYRSLVAKGDQGQQIWTEWAILAYNTDTLAVRER